MRINTNPSHWQGCKRGSRLLSRPLSAPVVANAQPFAWYEWENPTEDQGNVPSCAGHAWANWMELMIIRYVSKTALSPEDQLDADAVYYRACDMYRNGDYANGIYLEEGFMAMMDLGIIANGSVLMEVQSSWDAIATQLHSTPIVQGHVVDQGWFDPYVNKDNGCLDHTAPSSSQAGGHATVCDAALDQVSGETTIRFAGIMNSWGKPWGMNGHGVMTHDRWNNVRIAPPYAVDMVVDWEEDRGWEKYVIGRKP